MVVRKRTPLEQRVDKPVEPTPSAACAAMCYLCVSLNNKTGPCDVYTRWCCVVTEAEPCLILQLGTFVMLQY